MVDVQGEGGFGVVRDVVWNECSEDRVGRTDLGKEVREKGELQGLRSSMGHHKEDEPAAVLSHAFDCIRGDELGGDDEVCFAFP